MADTQIVSTKIVSEPIDFTQVLPVEILVKIFWNVLDNYKNLSKIILVSKTFYNIIRSIQLSFNLIYDNNILEKCHFINKNFTRSSISIDIDINIQSDDKNEVPFLNQFEYFDLNDLSFINNINNVDRLQLFNQSFIDDDAFINVSKRIQTLYISNCHYINYLPNISEELNVDECLGINNIPSDFSVKILNLSCLYNTNLTNFLSKLENNNTIEQLTLYGLDITNLSVLSTISSLKHLTIIECNKRFTIPFIPSLEYCSIQECKRFDLESCKNLKHVDTLELCSLPSINDEFIKQIENVKNLVLSHLKNITCNCLLYLQKSQSLTIFSCFQLTNSFFKLFTKFYNLHTLKLSSGCFIEKNDIDLSPLSNLSNLQFIEIQYLESITNEHLYCLKNVKYLKISYCKNITIDIKNHLTNIDLSLYHSFGFNPDNSPDNSQNTQFPMFNQLPQPPLPFGNLFGQPVDNNDLHFFNPPQNNN